MRALFSGVPGFGHLLPMLPLARAAQHGGHTVAFLTSDSMSDVLRPIPVLSAGPPLAAIIERFSATTGITDPTTLDPRAAAQVLAGTRVDLSLDEALAIASNFRPDLIVADPLDAVGPLVAAKLDLPWVVHAFGPVSPTATGASPSDELFTLMREMAAPRSAHRGINPTPRSAYLDPCPAQLQPRTWCPPANHQAINSGAHFGADAPWTPPLFLRQSRRPVVLISPSTNTLEVLGDTHSLPAMIESALAADVDLIVTTGPSTTLNLEPDPQRVAVLGFVPLGDLLPQVDAVISVGGIGTVLAAIGAGLPLVLFPRMADQPFNAQQVVRAGVGVTINNPDAAGPAINNILDRPSYQNAAKTMTSMPTPHDVVPRLVDLATRSQG